MAFTDVFVRRPVLASCLNLLILLAGLYSVGALTVRQYPRSDLAVVTVQTGDTLWSLAEEHLGDGARYAEIARLNYGRPQPDGQTLTSAHWIRPGWTLTLPIRTGHHGAAGRRGGGHAETGRHR